MGNILVLGASGDVGRGITAALLQRGHVVVAVARRLDRLRALSGDHGAPPTLHYLSGTLADDASAAQLLLDVQRLVPRIDGVVISVNASRELVPLLDNTSTEFAARIALDLVTHFTAARHFVPAITQGGVYLGIGGGSADFILEHGAHMSIAQAGLRMMYRGLAFELREKRIDIRELIIASVVNGANTREYADPLWVTDAEIGDYVAEIFANPAAFPGPILRMARRDATGHPVFSVEAATRVQGLRS